MKMTYNLLSEYDFFKFINNLNFWEPINEDQSKHVIDNGFMVPASFAYYKIKNIVIGVIENGQIVYYKAKRKA